MNLGDSAWVIPVIDPSKSLLHLLMSNDCSRASSIVPRRGQITCQTANNRPRSRVMEAWKYLQMCNNEKHATCLGIKLYISRERDGKRNLARGGLGTRPEG